MSKVDFTVSKLIARSWLEQQPKALRELARMAAKAFVRAKKQAGKKKP